MATRNIVFKEDDRIRKICRPVTEFNERLWQLLDDMAETMYKENGVGLAAIQVGILKRVVVIDVGEGLIELVNPEIIETEDEYDDIEGCLSCPGINGIVTRPYRTKVRAFDRNGKEFIIEGEELLSRCLNHEIDHLDGKLFIDRAEKLGDAESLIAELENR
ncbi:MAG: peptide deformylase [Oscillospiraceae bacterium]|nr:peptide deformylase [Oscillospiraceae bacterium]